MSPKALAQHRAREKFTRKLEQLRFELRVQAPRRVLDYLLEHLEDLLTPFEGTQEHDAYKQRLLEIKNAVVNRSHLRVVQ